MDRFICPEWQADYALAKCEAPADRSRHANDATMVFPIRRRDGWLHYRCLDTQVALRQ
jgi:hypothetical protein